MVAPAGLVGGYGSPEGVVMGNPGQSYRNLDNDDLYIKKTGTKTTGWVLVGKYSSTSGVGSSSGAPFYSSIDPTGVISVPGPSVCVGTGAQIGKVWLKTTAENSADDWFLLVV